MHPNYLLALLLSMVNLLVVCQPDNFTPFSWTGSVAWFVMFYCWFNSVYYFCLFCYPFFHNFMHSRRKKHGLWIAMGLMILWTETRTLALGSYALDAVRTAPGGFANGWILGAYFFP